MAHDDATRREARKLYAFKRQSLPTIAMTLTVSEATLRRWKADAKARGDDWDVARAANMVAGEGLEAVVATVIEDFVVLYQATIEAVKGDPDIAATDRVKAMASLADAFHKTIAASGRVSPKISELGVAMDVLKRLADFTRQHHPDRAGLLLEVLEPFGLHLSEVYGS
ncbi:MAG: hypothetical protein DI527_16240 [Chelatococcus sp.]|nr:MAG: hypothetical protein DI527_16240 [Chelatococcus sp.]